jgi:Rod binding domain-containing protein
MSPVASVTTESASRTRTDGPNPKAAVDPKIQEAAREFESMFVRQILSAAKVGGDHQESQGYEGMVVDALATGIAKGGGLGLAREIEDALLQVQSTLQQK